MYDGWRGAKCYVIRFKLKSEYQYEILALRCFAPAKCGSFKWWIKHLKLLMWINVHVLNC